VVEEVPEQVDQLREPTAAAVVVAILQELALREPVVETVSSFSDSNNKNIGTLHQL
jgi:hypothetical protein